MRTPAIVLSVAVVLVMSVTAACFGGDDDEQSSGSSDASASATVERSPQSSASPGASASPESSPSPTPSSSPEPSASPTGGGTTPTAEPTATPTATEAPTEAPTETPTATAEPTVDDSAYVSAARSGGATLQSQVTQLKNDMFAAQTRLDDAGSEATLRAGIAAVNGTIASLRSLQTPPAYTGFAADLEAAMAEIERGTAALTRAIDNEDQLAGLEAFTALNNGEAALQGALGQL